MIQVDDVPAKDIFRILYVLKINPLIMTRLGEPKNTPGLMRKSEEVPLSIGPALDDVSTQPI